MPVHPRLRYEVGVRQQIGKASDIVALEQLVEVALTKTLVSLQLSLTCCSSACTYLSLTLCVRFEQFLLRAGVSAWSVDLQGRTALALATENGHGAISLLLKVRF